MRLEGRCSTEGYGVEVDNVTLTMATVVFLLVHFEICDQDVFVVAERVVECHCALIVGGARRLRRGNTSWQKVSRKYKTGQSLPFNIFSFCRDIKGLKNII